MAVFSSEVLDTLRLTFYAQHNQNHGYWHEFKKKHYSRNYINK